MTGAVSVDGRCKSVLCTPDQLNDELPADSIVVIVSDDCIKAVDAAQKADVLHGIYLGDAADPALVEMRHELYDARS